MAMSGGWALACRFSVRRGRHHDTHNKIPTKPYFIHGCIETGMAVSNVLFRTYMLDIFLLLAASE
jgi:hypothetical protein